MAQKNTISLKTENTRILFVKIDATKTYTRADKWLHRIINMDLAPTYVVVNRTRIYNLQNTSGLVQAPHHSASAHLAP